MKAFANLFWQPKKADHRPRLNLKGCFLGAWHLGWIYVSD